MASRWWTLLAVCLSIFMLLLDITVVNVALPDIRRELGASFSDLQWVVDAYALGLAGLMLAMGSLADLLGRRRIFVIGLGLFVLASLICGLSTTPTMLNLFRGVQGIGGAMMFATSLALIAQEFPPNERGTAFGLWGATTGFAVAVGPLVGGALTEGLGWEWIFFVNVPIGLATAAMTLARVPKSELDPSARIDYVGLVTFSGALFCLVLALIRGNDEGWGSGFIVGLFVATVLLLVVFIVTELRIAQPMLDLSLFRKPAFTGAQIVAFSLHASMFAMFLYLTLYLQNILSYSPFEAGLRFLPISLLAFIAAPIAGKLAERLPVRAFLGGASSSSAAPCCSWGASIPRMAGPRCSPASSWPEWESASSTQHLQQPRSASSSRGEAAPRQGSTAPSDRSARPLESRGWAHSSRPKSPTSSARRSPACRCRPERRTGFLRG